MLTRLFAARKVNIAHAGIVIGAWEVDGLPNEWIDVFEGFVHDLPAIERQYEAFERKREQWRKQFKGAMQ